MSETLPGNHDLHQSLFYMLEMLHNNNLHIVLVLPVRTCNSHFNKICALGLRSECVATS